MSFLKRIWWPMSHANSPTTAGTSNDRATSSPPRSGAPQPRPGRRGRKVLKAFGMVFGAMFVAVAAVRLITWHSDYWQLRDRPILILIDAGSHLDCRAASSRMSETVYRLIELIASLARRRGPAAVSRYDPTGI